MIKKTILITSVTCIAVFIISIMIMQLISNTSISKYSKDYNENYIDSSKDSEVEVPEDLKQYFETVADRHDISAEFLEALSYVETGFNVNAEDGVHKGLLLVNVEVYIKGDWRDPQQNIEGAANYIEDLNQRYHCEELGDIVEHYHPGECIDEKIERVSNITLELEKKHKK